MSKAATALADPLEAFNTLTARLSQANSITLLLRMNLSEESPSQDIVEGVVWALSDILEQANAAAGVVADGKITAK